MTTLKNCGLWLALGAAFAGLAIAAASITANLTTRADAAPTPAPMVWTQDKDGRLIPMKEKGAK